MGKLPEGIIKIEVDLSAVSGVKQVQRLEVLCGQLMEKYPDGGWSVCQTNIDGPRVIYSRNDAYGKD